MITITVTNGEKETVVRRFKIPGTNRGFLAVCESGNCYTTFSGRAWWVFDLADHRDVDSTDRDAMLKVYDEERQVRDTEAFAAFIANKMRGQ
jgi:myo-inositol-hexaphosphate 3-phosphohydrolase